MMDTLLIDLGGTNIRIGIFESNDNIKMPEKIISLRINDYSGFKNN